MMRYLKLYIKLFLLSYLAIELFWLTMHWGDLKLNGLLTDSVGQNLQMLFTTWLIWTINYAVINFIGSAILASFGLATAFLFNRVTHVEPEKNDPQ